MKEAAAKLIENVPSQDVADSLAGRAGEVTAYGGAGAAIASWGFSVGDVAVVVSTIVAVLGFVLHAWATIRRDRRQADAHRILKEKHENGSSETHEEGTPGGS